MRATVGEPFTVALPAAPTTGYRWEGPRACGDVELLGQQFDAPPGDRPGDSGVQRFRLVAHAAGRLTLTFTLKRSWETAGVDERVVEVDVDDPGR